MRQTLKYIIFYTYYISIPIFITLSFKESFWFLIPSILLPLTMFLQTIDEISIVQFSPKLHKVVYHESGEYYIKYSGGQYFLYADRLLYKYLIGTFDRGYINSPQDILRRVKQKLDEVYAESISHRRSKTMLDEWDGYTSLDIKRDNKINQITN